MRRGTTVLAVMAATAIAGVGSAEASVQEVLVKGQTTLSDTYDPSTIYPWFGRLTYTHVKNVRPRGASVSSGLATKARALCERSFTHGGRNRYGVKLYPMVQIFANINGATDNLSNAPSAFQVDGKGFWKRSAYPGPEAIAHGSKVWAVAGFWDSTYSSVAAEIQDTMRYHHKTIIVDCESNITKSLIVP